MKGRGGGPRPGRPPKNSVWSYKLGKYVSNPPVPPPSTADGELGRKFVSSNFNASAIVPPPSQPLRSWSSWNSDDFEDAVRLVGRRQGPYRYCTRNLRDDSGQYKDGYYTQVCGCKIIIRGAIMFTDIPIALST